ncbi:MAG: glycosyltransferase [Collinsella sp.]|nr:glycosyltransferase [Collinsella sp.]
MITVSIVVPVYNVERYLPMCLDSLRNQTYRDIEIICVNDGSTDRSAQILDRYRLVEPRIRVVEKENGGLSSARNAGIRAAAGDVVCFVDSDDLVARNLAARVAEVFTATSADVVTFGGDPFPLNKHDAWLERVLSPRDAVYTAFTPDIFTDEAAEPFAWRTACRRDFLLENGLLFDEELRYGEDKIFHYAVYPRSSKTVFISDKLYLYRVGRAGSLMTTRSEDRYLRLYDHVRIVECISRDWFEAGFTEAYGSDLLKLMAEFILIEIMGAPVEWRTPLSNYLDAVWRTYFTEGQLAELMGDRIFGSMARAVLVDRRRAFGVQRKLAFYLNTLRGNPFEFVRRFGSRFTSIGPLRRVAQAVRNRLPMSSRRLNERFDDLAWRFEEDHALTDSLALLDIEVGALEGRADS